MALRVPRVTPTTWHSESEWRERAACRGTDVQAFFDPGRSSEAKAWCEACPVTSECGEWARRSMISDGFWAGKWAPNWTDEAPLQVHEVLFDPESGGDVFDCETDPRCGSVLGYMAGGRCPLCRIAIKDYEGCGTDPRCGSLRGYTLGGRCDKCREAYASWRGARRARFECGVDPRCGEPAGYRAGGRCAECQSAESERSSRGRSKFRCGSDSRCGTLAGYKAGGRCDKCREASSEYERSRRIECGVDPRCGTPPGYRAGGRCDKCREARAALVREKRP